MTSPSETTKDGWERSREPPRDVRDIFAGPPAAPPGAEERWSPLPGVLQMPGRLLGLLPRALRLPVVMLVAVAVVVIPLAGIAVRQEARAREARQERAEIAARAAALRSDQAPHSGRLAAQDTPVGALERYITADVRERQAAGTMQGTAALTTCRRARRTYACFTTVSRSQTNVGPLESGFHFTAALDPRTSRLTWCKENPRPIHPDTQGYVRLPLDPACLGERRRQGR